MKLGVIDYGAGNLRSVCNTFAALGVEPVLICSPQDMEGITHLVLPGVGSFGDCANKLRAQKMDEVICAWIVKDRPFLGICVGYQVLFEGSEESPSVPGLGIFEGNVVKFRDTSLKVPHMGWNSLLITHAEGELWHNMPENPFFYFVHSYYPQVVNREIVAATCSYGVEVDAIIQKGNIVATQFHPEKSQLLGSQFIQNFLTLFSSIS